MAPQLVIKNTFIHAFDEDEPSSPERDRARPRRRAHTLPVPFFASVEETCGEAAAAVPSTCDEVPPASDDASRCTGRGSDANAPEEGADGVPSAQLQRLLADPLSACLVAEEFRGRVREAARSPQDHEVLLELIRVLSTEEAAFIPAELCGNGRYAASNIYGHSVVCRLLAFSPEHAKTVELVDEVLATGVEALCCHKFGFSLAMSVLSNGLPHQRGQIVAALSTHVQRFARHRFASQVLEHALVAHYEMEECQRLLSELTRHSGGVAKLACHCFGTHIVRALLGVPATAKQVRASIMQAEPRLRKDRYGTQLLEDLAEDAPGPIVLNASLFGA